METTDIFTDNIFAESSVSRRSYRNRYHDIEEASTASTYKILFFGNVVNGHNKTDVAKRFASMLNIRNKDTLRKMFSGKSVTLKKGLSEEKAKQYSYSLFDMGVECCIEPEAPQFAGIQPDYLANKEDQKKKHKQGAPSALFSLGQLEGVDLTPK